MKNIILSLALLLPTQSLAIEACKFSPTGKMCQHIKKQVDCMAKAVYHEARGEPISGQKAVAFVINNRTNHKRFGDTVCKTVYQKAAFSGLKRSMVPHEKQAWKKAINIALDVYQGNIKDNTGGATFYHTPAVNPEWNQYMDVSTVIGNHIFYKWDGDWIK